jgi:hypothetical protein
LIKGLVKWSVTAKGIDNMKTVANRLSIGDKLDLYLNFIRTSKEAANPTPTATLI